MTIVGRGNDDCGAANYGIPIANSDTGTARGLCSGPLGWHTEPPREKLCREVAGVDLPQCRKCADGVLVPLSDYGPRGADLEFKVWACTNDACCFTVRIDKGVLQYERRTGPSRRRHGPHRL